MIYKRIIGYLFLSLLLVGQAGCQPKVGPIKTKQAVSAHFEQASVKESVQAKIKNYLLAKNINGNIAIIKDGKVIFNEGVGYANFQTGQLNKKLTTYPIGSITKSIVATSIMQLQEKGMLNIQDPVAKYLPGFPNGNNIKLVHLLNHTSGIRSPLFHFQKKTPEAFIKGVENRSVQFPAGTKWNYKDANYVILGSIVEKVTGISLHQYIQKNIFAKAGMQHSGFITKKNPVPYTSVGYIRNKDQKLSIKGIKGIKSQTLFGYADIYSTAYDLCMYDTALMNGKLVSKKSLQQILTPGSESGYGLGLYNFDYAVHSRGVIGGWESLHVYYKDKTTITVLLNVRDKSMDIHQVSKDLFQILDADTANPRFHKVGIGDAYSQGLLVVR
ncbi:serine hydrolase [Bacillus sp. EB600]|uniref:serine hydrolase domain-containing protein n=1 Tax=Bacillus sp. EB600 TaxID=2806345 RepID=UPI00210BFF57|nr:serine hydrolase domain-containing protein [Bacillus sp. EB600]MCQ6279024.1 beta-lactamase family protein [Bacillus sp. EB600]